MNDEIKTTPDENAASPEETVPQPDDAELRNELEDLKDTFQNVLDETTAQAEKEPVIQELDYRAEEPAEETAEEENKAANEAAESKKTKKKKEKKTGKKKHKAAVIIPIVLCVLIIIPLLAYFIVTIKIPDFNNFVSAYSSALTAKTAEEKLTGFENALTYCGEDSKLTAFRQDILENIVTATCETQGYAAAYEYMDANLTDEMKAAPVNKDFKEFLKIGDQLTGIALKLYNAAETAVGDAADTADVDWDAAAAALDLPEMIREDVKTALSYMGSGIATENTDTVTKEDLQMAVGSYFNAYSILDAMNADCSDFLEKIALKFYDYGYVYEAELIREQYLDADPENPYVSENADYNTLVSELDAVKNYDADLYAEAAAKYAEGKYTEEDLTAMLKDSGLSEKTVKALAGIALTAAQAMEAKDDCNLSKAAGYYSTLLGALNTFSFPVEEAAIEAISAFIGAGDTQSANAAKETFLADADVTDADAAAVLETLDKLYNAQNAANEIFSPHYYNYAYYGAEFDKAALTSELDELAEGSDDVYIKGFVDYYKYLAEAFTDNATEKMKEYVDSFSAALADHPLIYGAAALQFFRDNGEMDKAIDLAKKMLAVNKADDTANSIIALKARMDGDVETALKTAQAGLELSGETTACAYEAAIDLLLTGDLKGAFDITKDLYAASVTTNYCELIMIIADKYDGDDETMKTELQSMCAEIEELYGSYGVEASDAAKGILDGSLTLEDVFLGGSYDFN